MREDPIVSELRKYRLEHAAQYGHDLDRICAALRERQKESGRKVVTRSPRLLPDKADGKSHPPARCAE